MALIKILLVVLLCIALILGGLLLYTHFVTNSIADAGGMENPDYSDTAEYAQSMNDHECIIVENI